MRRFNSNIVRVKNSTTGDYEPLAALRGYSSYELAVANGFEGTEEEWMESIIGDGWVGAYQDISKRFDELTYDDIDGTLPIEQGGTNATNRKNAVANLLYLGENLTTVNDDTTSTWAGFGTGYCLIDTDGVVKNQPSTYGVLINYVVGGIVAQTWQQLGATGRTFHRGGIASGWYSEEWIEDYNSYNLKPATLDDNGKVTASQTCSRIIEVATETRTLAASDAGCMLMTRNANATSQNYTITVPLNSDVAIPVGTEIEILRYYGGTVTITAPTNVYLLAAGCTSDRSGQSITINNRYGVCALKKVYANYWIASGDVSVV